MIHIVDDEEPLRDALAFQLDSHGLATRPFDSALIRLAASTAFTLSG